MDVPLTTFEELQEIVRAEHQLRRRRYELIVVPVLPVTLLPVEPEAVTSCG